MSERPSGKAELSNVVHEPQVVNMEAERSQQPDRQQQQDISHQIVENPAALHFIELSGDRAPAHQIAGTGAAQPGGAQPPLAGPPSMKFAQNVLAHIENPQLFSLSARTASEETPAAGSYGILPGAPILAPLVLRIVPSRGYPRLASLLWIARILSRAALPSNVFPRRSWHCCVALHVLPWRELSFSSFFVFVVAE